MRTIDDQDRRNRDTLEVEGLLVFPRTGYTVGLQEAVHHHPRRSGELPVELTVNPPDGATDQTPTTVVARYTTKTTHPVPDWVPKGDYQVGLRRGDHPPQPRRRPGDGSRR